MATIWIDIIDMGGFGSKMERDTQLGGMEAPPIRNNGAKASRLPGNINLEANQSNQANSPKINNSSKATPNRISNNNYGTNVEAGLNLNTSVAATNNSSNSRRPSNANAVEQELESIEVNNEQTGGKRKSKARKSRKARKARKTRRTKH